MMSRHRIGVLADSTERALLDGNDSGTGEVVRSVWVGEHNVTCVSWIASGGSLIKKGEQGLSALDLITRSSVFDDIVFSEVHVVAINAQDSVHRDRRAGYAFVAEDRENRVPELPQTSWSYADLDTQLRTGVVVHAGLASIPFTDFYGLWSNKKGCKLYFDLALRKEFAKEFIRQRLLNIG